MSKKSTSIFGALLITSAVLTGNLSSSVEGNNAYPVSPVVTPETEDHLLNMLRERYTITGEYTPKMLGKIRRFTTTEGDLVILSSDILNNKDGAESAEAYFGRYVKVDGVKQYQPLGGGEINASVPSMALLPQGTFENEDEDYLVTIHWTVKGSNGEEEKTGVQVPLNFDPLGLEH